MFPPLKELLATLPSPRIAKTPRQARQTAPLLLMFPLAAGGPRTGASTRGQFALFWDCRRGGT